MVAGASGWEGSVADSSGLDCFGEEDEIFETLVDVSGCETLVGVLGAGAGFGSTALGCSGLCAGTLVVAASSFSGNPTDGSGVFTGALASFFGVLGRPFAEGVFVGSAAFGISATDSGAFFDGATDSLRDFMADFPESTFEDPSPFDAPAVGTDLVSDEAEIFKGGSCSGCSDCSSLLRTCFTAGPSLFLFGFVSSVFRGGLLRGGTFSCVLLAELAVGFIILAMKPPSAGVVEARLPFLNEAFVFFASDSFVLLAELAVGRIIRDKKSPLASEGLFVDVRVAECSADALPDDVDDCPS